MSKDPDSLAREKIVTHLRQNFFVEASAGSGKTTSLVNRMVALVEKGGDEGKGVPVEKICTITFTKAAADEFYARFQELLSKRSINIPDDTDKDLGPKTPDTCKRCQNALANIDLCFLGTIDAFANMVAHEMPNEIGIPSDATIISKEQRIMAIKESYNQMLCDYSHPLHNLAMMFQGAFAKPYQQYVTGVKTLLNKRNAKVNYNINLLNADESYFKKERDDFYSIVKVFASQTYVFGSGTTDRTRADCFRVIKQVYTNTLAKKSVDCIISFKQLLRAFKTIHDKKLPNKVVSGTQLDDPSYMTPVANSFELSKPVIDAMNAFKNKVDDYSYAIFFHFVSEAVKSVSESLQRKGMFDYNDFSYAVADAFKKSAATDRELVDHIFDRHQYILLDESQDTNPVQIRTFFYLTGTKIDSDWKKVEPKEGSLFIVGDPKQSIYCFREADVNSYLEMKNLFDAKGEVLNLSRNFRSNVRLKDWLNSAMNPILNHGKNGLQHTNIIIDPNERTITPLGSIASGDVLLDGEMKYYIEPSEEPEAIAQLIRTLVDNKQYKIISKNPNKSSPNPLIYRTIEYKDFLVVPRGTSVNNFVDAFSKYEIPMIVEADIPFNYSESLMLLTTLTQFMKTPSDRHLFLEILTSGLFGLDEKDVNSMLSSDFNLDVSDISKLNLANPEQTKAIKTLNRLYESTKGKSISSTMMILLNDKELSLLTKINPDYIEYTYFLPPSSAPTSKPASPSPSPPPPPKNS